MQRKIFLASYLATFTATFVAVFLSICIFVPLTDTAIASEIDQLGLGQNQVNSQIEQSPKDEQFILGEQKTIGEGTVQSWVKLDRNQKPLSVGINLTEAAVETAPPDDRSAAGKDGIKVKLQDGIGHQTFEYEIAIPNIPEAQIPFTHLGVNWNPYGHGPEGIFTAAHWDIHFYTIDAEYRRRISQYTDVHKRISDKLPPKGFTNPDYQLAPGTAEPRMGSHTADFSSPELAPGKFGNIFIYGIHNGQVIHWEPMVSDDFLKANSYAVQPIKLPELYSKSGYYPNTYTVKHDTANHQYVISLDNLSYHPAYSELKEAKL